MSRPSLFSHVGIAPFPPAPLHLLALLHAPPSPSKPIGDRKRERAIANEYGNFLTWDKTAAVEAERAFRNFWLELYQAAKSQNNDRAVDTRVIFQDYQHRFEGGERSMETMGTWAGRKVGRGSDPPGMLSDL